MKSANMRKLSMSNFANSDSHRRHCTDEYSAQKQCTGWCAEGESRGQQVVLCYYWLLQPLGLILQSFGLRGLYGLLEPSTGLTSAGKQFCVSHECYHFCTVFWSFFMWLFRLCLSCNCAKISFRFIPTSVVLFGTLSNSRWQAPVASRSAVAQGGCPCNPPCVTLLVLLPPSSTTTTTTYY